MKKILINGSKTFATANWQGKFSCKRIYPVSKSAREVKITLLYSAGKLFYIIFSI